MQAKDLIDYWRRYKIIKDKKVLDAFKRVKREFFVPKELEAAAYQDAPLPIGKGQTISQPTTIAIMTQALELKKGQKVLEIGTGSGYQAALIAHIIGKKGKVISIEIIPELAKQAKANLKTAGITNVKVIKADGSKGYKKEAPYDRIIVTAAAPQIPENLLSQLKAKGVLVAPVGSLYHQHMIRITKTKQGIKKENLGDFVFVPLKGKYGWD